ncbi:MAG: hypothetical protein AAFZ65_04890 [Planctomycetota bacterium]
MRTFLLAASLLPTPAIAQSVIVVDDGPGPDVDFNSLIDAVAAAGPEDVVLVREGTYNGFFAVNGSISIYAEGPGVELLGRPTVAFLEPDERVILHGFDVISTPMFGAGLSVDECEGAVWLERIRVFASGAPFFTGITAVTIDDSANVTVSDCTFEVSLEPDAEERAVEGLTVRSSSVQIFDSTVQGGLPSGPFSANAAEFRASEGFIKNSVFKGGPGSNGMEATSDEDCTNGLPGGAAVRVESDADLTFLSSRIQGGPGGLPGAGGSCMAGPQGAPFESDGSALPVLEDTVLPPRGFSLPNPLFTGMPAAATFEGTPGEFIWLLSSHDLAPTFEPLLSGVLIPADPAEVLFVGTIPQSGELDLPFTITLPGGTPYSLTWLQPLSFSSADAFLLGTPRAALVVGAGPATF